MFEPRLTNTQLEKHIEVIVNTKHYGPYKSTYTKGLFNLQVTPAQLDYILRESPIEITPFALDVLLSYGLGLAWKIFHDEVVL